VPTETAMECITRNGISRRFFYDVRADFSKIFLLSLPSSIKLLSRDNDNSFGL
jgi:hypothetical protein